MHVDFSQTKGRNGKLYERVLLRKSFRDPDTGKVRHRTFGNISSCSAEEIEAIRQALRHKGNLSELLENQMATASSKDGQSQFKQGPSVGAIALLQALAEQLGISKALGDERNGRLALWQVIARALDQGSRLSAVRLARDLGADTVLGLAKFDEDDLYSNLEWLQSEQTRIEKSLFEHRYATQERPSLFLYDVTSTYLEGDKNELAAFGYNRDGKRGKKQLVVGLLCDQDGVPLAIEAFRGNTNDTRTVASQIEKLRERFNASEITLVGDRGMLRGPQIQQLQEVGMHYITAISKPQIETLLNDGTLQMELFDNDLAEIIAEDQQGDTRPERYILRCNPERKKELERVRQEKKASLECDVARRNHYLATHPRAKETTALRKIQERIDKLKLGEWIKPMVVDRQIFLQVDQEALEEISKLEGCYVIRTDLTPQQADKELVHDRYKSLSHVEQAFRRAKTIELEMRPVHVRKETSTRGHLLVVMLAYILLNELGERWADLDLTVCEGLSRLNTYCAVEVAGRIQIMLKPRQDVAQLLEAAGVSLPTVLKTPASAVSTKKKLPKSRPSRKK